MGIKFLHCVSASLLLCGCSTVDYYSQTVAGHLQLMGQREPIDQLIEDGSTAEPLRRKLESIREIRDFASRELGLPDNESYRSYAAIDREAVVWAVVATEEFSVDPLHWCYPIIGCASYRGYFSQRKADYGAHRLVEDGMDVAVLPVPAYSTLGWFDDPIPSSVIQWPEPRLAGLVFHELAHQRLYVAGDTAFNEAFATTVQQTGVRRWLKHKGDAAALDRWRLQQQREQAFVALLLDARQRLAQLYGHLPAEQEARLLKTAEFERLKADYQLLKRRWGGYGGYDGWFQQLPNNAHLASVATYQQWVPACLLLLQRVGGDMQAFYLACERLGELTPQQRRQRMQSLLRAVPEDQSRSFPQDTRRNAE